MAVDMRLAAKGKGEPRDGLAQQAKVSVGLAKKYPAELGLNGWSVEDTTALEANTAKLESGVGKQAGARDAAGSAGVGESAAVDAAKAFARKLRNALPRALRDAGTTTVTASSFHAGEALARSTPKISKYFTTIRPAVAALDEPLKKHFGGESALAKLDAAKTALDTADVGQEIALTDIPAETLALYETMGRVLEGIEDLNRAGKSAFDGDANTSGKFNKDLLFRARRTRKAEPAAPEQPKAGDPAPPT